MLVSRQVILIGVETATGTPATLTGDNAVLVNSVSLTNTGARMIERPVIKESLSPYQQVYGGTLQQVQFSCEIKGAGSSAIGKAPEIGAALRACGFKETLTDGTSASYNTASAKEDLKSVTIELYQDGVYRQIVGARGTVSFTINAGEILTAEFTLTGHYGEHKDKETPSVTYDSTVPAALINLQGFKIGSNAANIGAMTLDIGNNIITPADITDDQGYGEVRISTRDITGTLDPEMALLKGGPNYLKDWMDGATPEITTGPIGPAGNQITFTIAKAAYREIGQGDRDGVITETLSFGAHEKNKDDEVVIVFK